MLTKILAHKRREVADKKEKVTLTSLKEKVKDCPQVCSFQKALQESKEISIIAEIKKASPSRGVIRPDFDPIKIAQSYQQAGAAAISVLTDQKFFQGNLQYLERVRQVTLLPLLRKDFIIDLYQIYEARIAGADAILLIADILSKPVLAEFCSVAKDLGLTILLEVHDQEGLEKAIWSGNSIIGINNRDLKTFKVDLSTTADLIPFIPEDRVIVSESGIFEAVHLRWLEDLGVDAVLIGEAFMVKENIESAFQSLRGYHDEFK